jgi:hypothetical protein
MTKRKIVAVASLLLALAASAWGQAVLNVNKAAGAANVKPGVIPQGGPPAGNFQPAPDGLGLAAITVAGVQINWFDANEWDEGGAANPGMANGVLGRPFPLQNSAGFASGSGLGQGLSYTLVLAGKFMVPVFKLNGATVDKVVTDSGEDLLLPANLLGYRPLMRQYLENGKIQPAKVFSGSLRLAVPGEKATTIKELSGKVYYTIMGKSRMVNLGFTELTAGAKGTELAAQIESIEDAQNNTGGGKVLKLTVNGQPEEFGESKFYDADGAAIAVQSWVRGQTPGNNTITLGFRSKVDFPATGRIEIEHYDDVKHLEAPFKLENVPLYGRPAKPGA